MAAPPPRPDIRLPDPPAPTPVNLPPPMSVTPADKNDPVPAPRSAALTGRPPANDPGAQASLVQELAFIVDPGSSQIPSSARSKLQDAARSMAGDSTIRVEVRVFSPAKPRNESVARRLSLARFLAIRDFLVGAGIDDNRIDGRALTSEPGEVNADRVELYIER